MRHSAISISDTDQYRLWEWNTICGSYSNAFLNQSVGKAYMFISTLTPNPISGIIIVFTINND